MRAPIHAVAGGVEAEGLARFLASLGFDCAQGFYYSRPVAPEAFEKLLSSAENLHTANVRAVGGALSLSVCA